MSDDFVANAFSVHTIETCLITAKLHLQKSNIVTDQQTCALSNPINLDHWHLCTVPKKKGSLHHQLDLLYLLSLLFNRCFSLIASHQPLIKALAHLKKDRMLYLKAARRCGSDTFRFLGWKACVVASAIETRADTNRKFFAGFFFAGYCCAASFFPFLQVFFSGLSYHNWNSTVIY